MNKENTKRLRCATDALFIVIGISILFSAVAYGVLYAETGRYADAAQRLLEGLENFWIVNSIIFCFLWFCLYKYQFITD